MYEYIIKKLKQQTSDPLLTQLPEFFWKSSLEKKAGKEPDQYIRKHVNCSSTSKKDNSNCQESPYLGNTYSITCTKLCAKLCPTL